MLRLNLVVLLSFFLSLASASPKLYGNAYSSTSTETTTSSAPYGHYGNTKTVTKYITTSAKDPHGYQKTVTSIKTATTCPHPGYYGSTLTLTKYKTKTVSGRHSYATYRATASNPSSHQYDPSTCKKETVTVTATYSRSLSTTTMNGQGSATTVTHSTTLYHTTTSVSTYTTTVTGSCTDFAPNPSATCELGTGIGYVPSLSHRFNDDLHIANRWGWAINAKLPTKTSPGSFPSGSLTGTLYVGAANNNLNAALAVGSVGASYQNGKITMSFTMDPTHQFALMQLHVYVACNRPANTAFGTWTLQASNLSGSQAYTYTSSAVDVSGCSDSVWLAWHAGVGEVYPPDSSCPPVDKANM